MARYVVWHTISRSEQKIGACSGMYSLLQLD